MKAYYYRKSSINNGSQQERRKETRELQSSQKIISKMALVSPYLLTVTVKCKWIDQKI